MMDIANAALNFLFGGSQDADNWELKRRADEQMAEMRIRQLEQLTGRDRLDLAVNGYTASPLDIVSEPK